MDTNPETVAALNAAREVATKSGGDPYAGNLKDYSTFATSPTPPSGGNTGDSPRLSDRYAKDRQAITDAYGLVEKPDEQAIRDQKQKLAQASINAVNSKYATIEANDAATVDLMNRERRAANVLGGLSGSNVGAARTIDTANKGAELQKRTAQQKESEVGALLANAEARGTEEFKAERAAYISQQKDKITAQQSLDDRIRESAGKELEALAGSKSFDDLKKTNPSLLRQYEKELGATEDTLRAMFVKASASAWEKVKDIDAGDKQIFVYRNPNTGEMKTEEIKTPGAGFKFVPSIGKDGGWVNESTKEVKWVTGPSVSSSSGGGSGDSAYFSPDEVRDINKAKITNTDLTVKKIFSEAPAGFKKAYIVNGFGNPEVTPEILIRNIEEWETNNPGKSGGSSSSGASDSYDNYP